MKQILKVRYKSKKMNPIILIRFEEYMSPFSDGSRGAQVRRTRTTTCLMDVKEETSVGASNMRRLSMQEVWY